MKKAGMGLLVLFFCCCLMLTGCGASSKGEPSLVVYSFKGENEQFSISNGVIVLTPNEEIFYGGCARYDEFIPRQILIWMLWI